MPYEAATSSSCTTMPFVTFSLLQILFLSLTVIFPWFCRITSDKSSYWQPNMYYEWENKTWSALEGVTNITVRTPFSLLPPHLPSTDIATS